MRAVVTGGGGFLGRAIVEALRARGDDVLSVSRHPHPELEELGARATALDVRDAAALERAFEGADCVFHAAAKAGVFGPRDEYFAVNVDGTQNVVAACRAAGVPRLVHTSSPSVCFDGRPHVRAGNDLPYARRFLAAYPESKAEAEREVLSANGRDGLATCVLRPHLVIGPRDPHLVPRLLDRARRRRLFVVGDGRNEVSLTWVENAARAHVCAADALEPGAACAGRAYFVGQEEPVRLWDWIGALLERLGLPPARRRVPASVARAAGATLEAAWRVLRRPGEPPMTRFLAGQLSTSHSYDMAPARRDFGYTELVSTREATDRLVRSLLGEDVGSPAR